jgi:cobalt/nickel transport system permease protein
MINKWHPSIKIIITFIYILILTSVDGYELGKVLLFGVYPILLLSIADIPTRVIASKLIIPAFISISLVAFNPLFDQEIVLVINNIGISGGVISLCSLFSKSLFTISATLILVSTTSIEKIGDGLRWLRIPKKLVILLLLVYRYIGVLLDEVSKTIEAYQLRANGGSGIHISAWGSLVGQIIIRSIKRSEEIYNAMLLRGYHIGDEE